MIYITKSLIKKIINDCINKSYIYNNQKIKYVSSTDFALFGDKQHNAD